MKYTKENTVFLKGSSGTYYYCSQEVLNGTLGSNTNASITVNTFDGRFGCAPVSELKTIYWVNIPTSIQKELADKELFKSLFSLETTKLEPNSAYVFVRYKNGNAYYYMQRVYWEGATERSTVSIYHLLDSTSYNSTKSALKEVKWEDIQRSYRLDARALNAAVRAITPDEGVISDTSGSSRGIETAFPIGTLIERVNDTPYNFGASAGAICQVIDGLRGNHQKVEVVYNPTCPSSMGSFHAIRPSNFVRYYKSVESTIGDIFLTPNNINKPQTSNKMKNLFSSMGFEFGKFESDKLAYSPMGIAVKKRDGDFVAYDRPNRRLIEIGDFKMGLDFYKIPVQQLAEGDYTEIDGTIYLVDNIASNGDIHCICPSTGSKATKIPRTNLMGMYFYTRIVSIFDMMSGNAQQPGVQGNFFGNINPMMLMMMSKDDNTGNSGNDMMEMMMMSQMFQGAGNPMSQMFGGVTAAKAKPATKARKTTARK